MRFVHRAFELGREFVVELVEHVGPPLRALRHLVEFAFDLPRVADLDELVAEAPLEESGDRLADGRRVESSLLLHDIAAVLDHVDNTGIGRGTADPLLLHLLDERRFGVAWWRRLKLLPRLDLEGRQFRALLEVGQHLVAIVLGRAAHGIKTIEPQHAAARFEHGAGVAVAPSHADTRRIPFGVGRLAGEEALPDQPIDLHLLIGERRGDAVGIASRVGWPDRLVGLLGALVGAGVGAGLLRHILPTVPLLEVAPRHVDGLFGEVCRVGTHVGDQAHPALARQVDALVELLGDPHRAVGRHAEPAAGGLLQGACDERRIRPRTSPRDVDRFHGKPGGGIWSAGDPHDVFTAAFAVGHGLTIDAHVEQAGCLGSLPGRHGEVDGRVLVCLDPQWLAAHLDQIARQRTSIGQPRHPVPHQRSPTAFIALRHQRCPLCVQGDGGT